MIFQHYYNDIEIYPTHNEGKLVDKVFITFLKKKIDKYLTSISKNMLIDGLDVITTMHIIEKSKLNLPMLSLVHNLTWKLNVMIKILNLKLMTTKKLQNIKILLQKVTSGSCQKNILSLKKSKNIVP